MESHSLESYRLFIDCLGQAMIDDHVAVNPKTNPVAVRLGGMVPDTIAYVIQQYAFFPRSIVSLLYSARAAVRVAGWAEVDRELTRNLGQELGSETEGIPHSEMLLQGIEKGLGLRGVRETTPGPGTRKFVTVMKQLFAPEHTVAYIGGAAYALEASAVPEIDIVRDIIEHFRILQGLSGGDYDALARFFDAHRTVWEPSHEAGLRRAYRTRLEDIERRQCFATGFHAVMASMDHWWRALAAESIGKNG